MTVNSDYIMLPRDYSVSEECIFEDAYENESFGQYAKRVGKKILKVNVDLDVKESLDNNYNSSIDSKLIDADNSIMYVSISSSIGDTDRIQEGTNLDLHYYVDVCDDPEDEINWSVAKDEIVSVVVENVSNSSSECFYVLPNNQEMVVEDSGISYKKMDFPDHVNIRVKNLNNGEVYYLRNIPCVK